MEYNSCRYPVIINNIPLFRLLIVNNPLLTNFGRKTRNVMENIYDILKISIPALLVLLMAWLVLRNLLRNDQEKRKQEFILQNTKTITPVKLHAYERLVLFLERISLESLLVRVSSPGMSATELHSSLLLTIRTEFEHNLSQQIYMTQQAWEVVRNARSQMIKIINTEMEKMPAGASAMDLSKVLLGKVMEMDKEPTRAAIDFLKAEAGKIVF